MYINHVAMYVNDLEKTKDFFIKYFLGRSNNGYHNVKTGFKSYFLTFDDKTRLEIMNRPGITNTERGQFGRGFMHIAFSVGNKENVEILTQRLKADGYTVISLPRTTGDGYYESCVLDLEGNQIEITI